MSERTRIRMLLDGLEYEVVALEGISQKEHMANIHKELHTCQSLNLELSNGNAVVLGSHAMQSAIFIIGNSNLPSDTVKLPGSE